MREDKANLAQLQSHTYPIVGAFYRPPASAILGVLPVGTKLTLKAEPTNEVDPNAIAVYIETSEIKTIVANEAAEKLLASEALNSGISLDDILSNASSYHLGYIPRAIAAKIKLNSDTPAKFTTSLDGRASVIFNLS
jgi:HIRAN domain